MFGPMRALEQEALKPKSVGATLGRFVGYFKPYGVVLFLVTLMLVLNTYTQVISPELIGQAVDCYLTPTAASTGGVPALPGMSEAAAASASNCWFDETPFAPDSTDRLDGLLRLVLVVVALYIVGSAMGGLMFFAMGWMGQHVLRTLRLKLFTHMQRLSLGFYSRNETGDLMSRITNDTDTIQQMLSFALIQVLSGALLIVWIGWTMLSLNWAYGLLSLSIVPVMAIATIWFSDQARRAFRETSPEHWRRQRRTGREHCRRARGPGL